MLRLLGPAAMAGALLAAACGSGGGEEPGLDSGTPSGAQLTQTAEVGGVSVEATWLTEEGLRALEADVGAYSLEEFVLVEMNFTTHSGDLNEIDMEQDAVLAQGGREVRPEAWVTTSDDAHHRAGVLVFPRDLKDGPIELTIDMGEDLLALSWESVPGA